ncbi:MAG TPA: ABC transporter permease [Acidimicrobiia bacterium]|nr:ABC transporter permease [Acidimicrobiia bacterium]
MTVQSAIRRRGPLERTLAAHSWLVYLFFYAPIIVLIIFSFNDGRQVSIWQGASLRWYRQMLQDAALMSALRNSLIVAVVSTVVSTVLGTATALAMERFRFRTQRVYDGLLYLPIIVPEVTLAAMMLVFFIQAFDIIGRLTGSTPNLSLTTIILSHICFNISFVTVVVRARLAGLDPNLEEAAADLYASRWKAFSRVTLPLIMPGVLGGALLALTMSLDDVVTTSFVSGPGSTTLPVYVFGLVKKGVTPVINAVSVLMLLVSMALVLGSLVLQRGGGARKTRQLKKETTT